MNSFRDNNNSEWPEDSLLEPSPQITKSKSTLIEYGVGIGFLLLVYIILAALYISSQQ